MLFQTWQLWTKVFLFLFSTTQAPTSAFTLFWDRIRYYRPTSRVNAVAWVFYYAVWGKARVLYYTNNWIYTTNHKRIAVNYFWFVILAGICGMILATIIRLEMAYPGVGVLAGDSLQYLSVVTAHAVIMVFFMIMPLLFGAFGNFLLPTQLGVHDVAFPRLNSAAFWFLPAGLLMLCQLVCLDRRYQRMNCLNIREVEALLKGRFFPDLVNTKDNRDLLNSTVVGLRFKLNTGELHHPTFLLAQTYGLDLAPTMTTLQAQLSEHDVLTTYSTWGVDSGTSLRTALGSGFYSTLSWPLALLYDFHRFYTFFF